jgi:hypothetical protein
MLRPSLETKSQEQRCAAVRNFYRRIPQESFLEGAGADLEAGLQLVLGGNTDNLADMQLQDRLLAASMCEDLQTLDDEVDSESYAELGLDICNQILGDESIAWNDEDKMSAAKMWENFKFEQLRRAELAGEDVYARVEDVMSRSLARFSRAANEVFAMPEKSREEAELRTERLGKIYEWAMAILWRQESISEDSYEYTAVRHANMRQDSAIENNRDGSAKSGNFDVLKAVYAQDGELIERRYLQVKMGNTSTHQYRRPVEKVTLDGINVAIPIEATRALAKVYAPLMRDVPQDMRLRYTSNDKQKFHLALDAVRYTRDT